LPRRSTRRSITSRTLSGSAIAPERSTLQLPLSSSKMSAPDSQRPRRISPTKRVAIGLGRDLLRQLKDVLVELVPGGGRHDLGHLV
jgi:hypothetical protein